MADSVPPGRRIDRPALERIIQRAAELQAREREVGDGLTEDEVLELGTEVGISAVHLRQALLEEQTRAVVSGETGIATWLAGPRVVVAERVFRGSVDYEGEALKTWMEEGELLTVKRRYPDATAWEPRRGPVATIRRSIGAGGRQYRLARAREIVTRVVPVDSDRVHVRLVADLSNTRREHLGGAAGLVIAGGGIAAVAVTLGVALPFAVAPVPLGLALGFATARARRSQLEQMQTALEQILDRLEHREIAVERDTSPRQHPLHRLADEIRRQLTD